MAIETTESRIELATNGVTASYTFPYRVLEAGDLVVKLVNTTTGVETPQTLDVTYTLTGVGDEAGVGIVPDTAADYATGHTLIAYRDPALTQPVEMVQNDNLPVNDYIERPLDRLTMIAQRLRDIISRVVQLDDSDLAATMTVPLLADRAGKYWAWDSLGNLIASAAAISTAAMSTFFQTLIGAADAAALRALIFAAKSGDVGLTDITMKTARLLGRFTASNGAIEEVVIGSGLSLSGGGTLTATGAWASVAGSPFTVAAAADLECTGLTGATWYEVLIESLLPATNNVDIYMDVSTDGGSTWENTGYYWGLTGVVPASTAALVAASSDTEATLGTSQYNLQPLAGSMRVMSFSGRCSVTGEFATLTNAGAALIWNFGLTWFGSGTVNAIRFRASSGNITGTVRVIGVTP